MKAVCMCVGVVSYATYVFPQCMNLHLLHHRHSVRNEPSTMLLTVWLQAKGQLNELVKLISGSVVLLESHSSQMTYLSFGGAVISTTTSTFPSPDFEWLISLCRPSHFLLTKFPNPLDYWADSCQKQIYCILFNAIKHHLAVAKLSVTNYKITNIAVSEFGLWLWCRKMVYKGRLWALFWFGGCFVSLCR